MADFSLLLWATLPPLLLLGYYYRREPHAPPLLWLLLCFILGAVSGVVALGLESAFETVANSALGWQKLKYSLLGVALRQFVEVGPIEEGCKFVAVFAPVCYFQRHRQVRASSVFLFTIAVALGFTAEENWIYLFYGTASILDRTIGTPVHALFSAPWGYALGKYISPAAGLEPDKKLIARALINSIICHALVNVLSIAWRYSPPLRFLSYGLFPLLLWMFWRLEQLRRRLQGKQPIKMISGYSIAHRYWQRGLVLFALMLGGNAIFGLLLLGRKLSPLRPIQLLYPDIFWYTVSRLSLNLFCGVLAWLIYRYLRYSARRYL